MAYNVRDSYLENHVLGATPLELVSILYQEATKSIREAIRQLEHGDIRGRSRAVTRAQLILAELANSLDMEAGGDIARNLSDLYGYMQSRLVEANLAQSSSMLGEVLRLLTILEDGWKQCAQSERGTDAERNEYREVAQAL